MSITNTTPQTVVITVGTSQQEVTLPDGLGHEHIIAGGPLLKGDLTYNPFVRRFEPVLIDGNVLVQQCHLVVRPPTAPVETATSVLTEIKTVGGKPARFYTLNEFIDWARANGGDGFATASETETLKAVREHGFDVVRGYIAAGLIWVDDLTADERDLANVCLACPRQIPRARFGSGYCSASCKSSVKTAPPQSRGIFGQPHDHPAGTGCTETCPSAPPAADASRPAEEPVQLHQRKHEVKELISRHGLELSEVVDIMRELLPDQMIDYPRVRRLKAIEPTFCDTNVCVHHTEMTRTAVVYDNDETELYCPRCDFSLTVDEDDEEDEKADVEHPDGPYVCDGCGRRTIESPGLGDVCKECGSSEFTLADVSGVDNMQLPPFPASGETVQCVACGNKTARYDQSQDHYYCTEDGCNGVRMTKRNIARKILEEGLTLTDVIDVVCDLNPFVGVAFSEQIAEYIKRKAWPNLSAPTRGQAKEYFMPTIQEYAAEIAAGTKHRCDNCQFTFITNDAGLIINHDPPVEKEGSHFVGDNYGLHTVDRLAERLDPSAVVPSGECPDCGCLAYLVTPNPDVQPRHDDRIVYDGAPPKITNVFGCIDGETGELLLVQISNCYAPNHQLDFRVLRETSPGFASDETIARGCFDAYGGKVQIIVDALPDDEVPDDPREIVQLFPFPKQGGN